MNDNDVFFQFFFFSLMKRIIAELIYLDKKINHRGRLGKNNYLLITQICCHLKTQNCLSVSRKKELIVKFVINYHPSATKLSISASGQRQSRPVWIET